MLRPAFLMQERRIQLARKPLGYAGSALVGVAFGAAWTPCIGPILGAILTLAAEAASVAQGTALLGVYALGLAVPFVLTAVALDRFLVWFQRFRPYIVWVERIAGVMLDTSGCAPDHRPLQLARGILARTDPRISEAAVVETSTAGTTFLY